MTAKTRAKKNSPPRIDIINETPEEILKAFEDCCELHGGQITVDNLIFKQKKKKGFLQWGRNGGKTTYMAHAPAKHAGLTPDARNYVIYPEKTQGHEVLWASGVLRKMIPPKFIKNTTANRKSYLKNELRIELWNNSFVKILGADDPDALRGIKPTFCAFDEYRDFKENVYWNMEANFVAKNAILVIGSTPPDVAGHYSEIREFFITESKRTNSEYFYIELPSEVNPHLDRNELAAIKRRLVAHGQLRVWEREYMAKYIPGGASSVFPMFTDAKEDIVKSHHLIVSLLEPGKHVIEYYAVFDPATSSVFGGLLIAYNRFTGQVYVLDEIYERDRLKTSSGDIWTRARKMKKEFQSDLSRWENVYDEHEAWFSRDLDRHELLLPSESLNSTEKASRNIEEDLSIIKDLMLLKNRYFISDRCVNLVNEFEAFQTDANGKIIRKKNHLIDCMRYFIAASQYQINEQPNYAEYLERAKESGNLAELSFEKYYRNKRKQEDWTSDLDEEALADDVYYLEDMDNDAIFN